MQIDNSPHKLNWMAAIIQQFGSWEVFMEKMLNPEEHIDPCGIVPKGLSEYLDRKIIILAPEYDFQAVVVETRKSQQDFPCIWLHWESKLDSKTKFSKFGNFCSLNCLEGNHLSPWSSEEMVVKDVRSLSTEEIYQIVKDKIFKGKGNNINLKVVGYHSKVIRHEDSCRPIHEHETAAMLENLKAFDKYLQVAPLVLAFMDSRSSYYLFSPGTNQSAVKVRRYNVLVQTLYPNIRFYLLPTEANIADILTRMGKVPEEIVPQVELRGRKLTEFPELDHSIMSAKELQQFSNQYQHLLVERLVEDKNNKLFRNLKILEKVISPLKVLAERLSLQKIIETQQKELDFYHDVRRGKSHEGLIFKDDLIMKQDKIFIPPSLVPIAVSYGHLRVGHGGKEKIWKFLELFYFFPRLREMVENLASSCQACLVNNPMTGRKLRLGKYPLPSFPFHTVFADLSENVPKNKDGINHLLIITCYLSKMVFILPLKNKSGSGVTQQIKLFLMFTNFQTQVFISDNATCFRSAALTQMLGVLGIAMPDTAAYSPKSRGAVEVVVKQVTLVMKKMLVNENNFDVGSVFFLTAAILNNTYHEAIGCAPVELVSPTPGHFGQSSLGAQLYMPGKVELLLHNTAADVEKLQEILTNNINQARVTLEGVREKQHSKYNKNKSSEKGIKVGDIVFVKSHRIPPPGVSPKYWPKLLKSPFMVVEVYKVSVMVMRLVDRFLTTMHKDDVKLFSKKNSIFNELPKEVLNIIGAPIGTKELAELAQNDSLDPIYDDAVYWNPLEDSIARNKPKRGVVVRGKKVNRPILKKQKRFPPQTKKNGGIFAPPDEDDLAHYPKQVSFDLGGEEEENKSH